MSVQSQIQERTRTGLKEPRMYQVVMHNDDFTTMEFVVDILISIFHKDEASAQEIMLKVHKQGRAAVGIYPYDLAVSRVRDSMARAKAEGFPFRMTVEEA